MKLNQKLILNYTTFTEFSPFISTFPTWLPAAVSVLILTWGWRVVY